MNIFDASILGIIEGITEFLPISSTGHMIVASKFLGLAQSDFTKAFEVIIQLGAILAVLFSYKEEFTFKKIGLWTKIFISFLPIGIVGFLLAKQVKEIFSVEIVAIMFIIGGIIFIVVEKFYKEDKQTHLDDIEKISYKQALYIGIAQVFALIPGTSRAGSTIIGAMLVKLTRKAAAKYSFLLAFPVMLAVTAYDFLKHFHEFVGARADVLAIGFIIAFFVALISMKLFMRFLEKFSFVSFGVYRIIFGIFLLVFFQYF